MLTWALTWFWLRLRGHYAGPWILSPRASCDRHAIRFERCPGHYAGPFWLSGVGCDYRCSRCAYLVHLGL